MKFNPHEYQRLGMRLLASEPKAGLFLEMGLGKTAITLTAIANLISLEEVEKVLVIAPLATAQNTWQDECAKWDHLTELRLSHVLGSAAQRRAALEADADIYVINRENVCWLCDELSEWPFDMVVIDELSSFKNPAAKRFKALRKKMPYVKRVVGLTGTPAPNGYMDLWSEVYLLDRGERLGRTLGEYRNRYFKPGRRNGYVVYEWNLQSGAKEVIDQKLSDICISMQSVDWLKMPDRVDTELYVTMDEKERAVYDRFGRDHVLPEEGVVGLTAASVQNKLLQMANGFAYDEDGQPHPIHTRKLEALEELVEAAAGRPMLVYYEFIEDKERILKQFPQAVMLKGRDGIKAWNNGEIQMLVAHPASAGHGLNLQAGGSTIVWYGLPWSLELYQQANARLYRQGQKNTVFVYHLLTKDTHDTDVLNALRSKDLTQSSLIAALKARVEGWRNGKTA